MTIQNEHVIEYLHKKCHDLAAQYKPWEEIEIDIMAVDSKINWEMQLEKPWFSTAGADFQANTFDVWQKGAVLIPKYRPDIKKCRDAAKEANRWIMENLK